MWRAPPPGVLKRADLDSMTAIYDRRSGETHVVAAVVPAILDALEGKALALEALAQQLGVDDTGALAERLDEMATVGLLERL